MTAETTDKENQERQEQDGVSRLDSLREKLRNAGVVGGDDDAAPEPEPRNDAEEGENNAEREQAEQGDPKGAEERQPEGDANNEDPDLEQDVKNPQAENFDRLRKKAKGYKAEAGEWKSKYEQLQEQMRSNQHGAQELGSRTPGASDDGASKQELKTDDVVKAYVQARTSDMFGARAEEVERTALSILERRMSPAEWYDLRTRAMRGEFGTGSEDIAALCTEQIPLATARKEKRSNEDQRVQQERENFVNNFKTKVKESFDKVYDEHPDLKDPKTELAQSVQKWLDRYVGTVKPDGSIENPGPLAGMLQTPDFPEKLFPMAVEYVNANKRRTVESADRTAPASSGAGGGTRLAGGAGAGSRKDQLRAKLRALGKVGSR